MLSDAKGGGAFVCIDPRAISAQSRGQWVEDTNPRLPGEIRGLLTLLNNPRAVSVAPSTFAHVFN